MATIYVIHDPVDRPFVESTLLKPLPSLGFDRWIPSENDDPAALASCAAMIVVVSEASRRSGIVRRATASALRDRRTLVPIRLDETEPDAVAPGLGKLALIDLRLSPKAAADERSTFVRARLPELLPSVPATTREADGGGILIEWNEEVFSDYLKQAVARHDFSRGESLLASLERHLARRPYPYAAAHARFDLGTLRSKRQFQLMGRYAELVIASGTDDPQVQRQLAQSLIERGRFGEAGQQLERLSMSLPPGHSEQIEAAGLLGRLFKQQYVNRPEAPEAATLLPVAFHNYFSVYESDPENIWHGVNAASLLLRGARDGNRWASREQAREIATAILELLARRQEKDGLQVWDRATRVEALIALDRFADAELALEEYLGDPGMNAFEVSSTFRQFDEVLQLAARPEGLAIHAKLLHAVDRYRAGGVTSRPHGSDLVARELPVLIRVSDPKWEPADTLDVSIDGRLGTVISARASFHAVQALLKDPVAQSIEMSGTVDDTEVAECDEGMRLINTSETYDALGQTFREKGGRALVALIDSGVDVLHEAFTDANGKTRIVGIWNQRDNSGPPPPGCTYGRFHSEADIQGYIVSRAVPASLGRDPLKHGTHVASIAAGRAVGSFQGGVAPEARLLVVVTKLDGNVGYSKAHTDALLFIERTAIDLNVPVVVNVSKGSNAGAHDGKSPFETSFDAFSRGGTAPGRVVVKSSGNERNRNRHAAFRARSADRLPWRRQQPLAHGNREEIELWWSAADRLSFTLVAPSGARSNMVNDRSPTDVGTFAPGGVYSLQLTKSYVDNGDSKLAVVLNGDGSMETGEWALELVADEVRTAGVMHAWIGSGGNALGQFVDFVNHEMTLTVPATANSVIAVAAIEPIKKPVVGRFSSHGPTRDGREKPEIAAPGVGIVAADAGSFNQVRPDSGTSMAAPHVAGAIALVLSRAVAMGRPCPNANQLQKALAHSAIDFDGHFDPGRGFGILDVAALLAAFE